MKTPDLTFLIVTPSYNQAQFIGQTIDSVLNQSVNLEYVVMDGDSTDSTNKLLASYDKKLTWFSKPDKGQTDAINKGIRYFEKVVAKKKLDPEKCVFAYLNSDDYYQPLALKHVATALEAAPNKQWLVGDCVIVDQDGQPIQAAIRLYKQLGRFFLSWPLLLILNPIPQPATFVRWSTLQSTGLFSDHLRYVMDYEYWLRLYQKYGSPLLVQHTLAAFRIHGQSKGGSQFTQQFAEQYSVSHRFTQNRLLLWLQSVHNSLIIFMYRIVKS